MLLILIFFKNFTNASPLATLPNKLLTKSEFLTKCITNFNCTVKTDTNKGGWIGQWSRLLACQLRSAAAAARPGAPRFFRSAR